jgi:hypothetical protein
LLLSLVKEERCSEGEISVGSVQVAFSCCRIEASKASKLGDQSVVVGCSFRHYRWMTLQLKMRVLLGLV